MFSIKRFSRCLAILVGQICYSDVVYLITTKRCVLASSNVNIKGNLTALEGNEINLACSYTPGIPNVTNVFFGVNDQEFSVRCSLAFITSMQLKQLCNFLALN